MMHAGYERAPLPPIKESDPEAAEEAAPRDSPARDSAGKGEKKPSKPRDPFLDNAKYLTIVLVAIGHSWDPLRDASRTVSALYFVVYTFHMPAFVIISGYLSRSFEGKPRQIQRLITGVAVPYFVIQTVYTFFMRWAQDNPERPFAYQEPGFALWFLIALFIWRLTTPVWKSLRWPLPVALAIAVAAGVTPSIGGDLNLMRVLCFLPFFVLGLQLKPAHFDLVRTRRARMIAGPVLVAAVVFAYWAVPRMSKQWFLHDKSAQYMHVPSWVDAMMTLAVFGCGLVLTACFLAWVPRRHTWFTALGAGTLYAYLLHIFVIQSSREFGWYDAPWVDHPISRVAITVAAAVMMTALCTRPVQRVFRFALEPRMDWFFPQDPAEQARKRQGQAAGRKA